MNSRIKDLGNYKQLKLIFGCHRVLKVSFLPLE
jgi:hypothetical protein